MFNKLKFEEKFSIEQIYPTTHDAVLHIVHRKRLERSKQQKSQPAEPRLEFTIESSEIHTDIKYIDQGENGIIQEVSL